MSGRGCTIIVKVLGGSTGNGDVEDLSLPVALHSPLQVLKEQLMDIVGIPVSAQVLILCDLTDPDRNSDRLLSGWEASTLRACGIRNGAVLTLHALGISAEQKQKLTKDAWAKKNDGFDPYAAPRHTLPTYISAADANHSYNGVIFDVESSGPHEVDLHSIWIAGMLGRVRVYARDRQWEDEVPHTASNAHWWAHRESVSTEGWVQIADQACWPSWDKPIEIVFDKPVKLLPHTTRALYCHSGLPDDLGIQYQSYKKSDIVAEDDHIVIRPGLGHTGAEPFDEVHGWYRAYRALAGSITYSVRRKGWNPFEHAIFPVPLKEAVMTLLMCQNQDHFLGRTERSSSSSQQIHDYDPFSNTNSVMGASASWSPPGMRNHQLLKRDREEQRKSDLVSAEEQEEDGPVLKVSANDPNYIAPYSLQAPATMTMMNNGHHQRGEDQTGPSSRPIFIRADLEDTVMKQLKEACKGRKISGIPVYVIYHILEYLHWDWFEERYEFDTDAAPCTPQTARRTARRLSESGSSSSPPRSGSGVHNTRNLLYHLLQGVTSAGIPGLHQLGNFQYSTGAQLYMDSDDDHDDYEDEWDEEDDDEDDDEEDDDDDDDDEDDNSDDSEEEKEQEEDGEENESNYESGDSDGGDSVERIESSKDGDDSHNDDDEVDVVEDEVDDEESPESSAMEEED